MDRGPAALFGAIVAVGLGPAMWLGVKLGTVEVAPIRPPAVVGEHTSGPEQLVGGTGAGDSPLGDTPTIQATQRAKIEPLAVTSPSPSATRTSPAPTATTTLPSQSPTPSESAPSTPPTESTATPSTSPSEHTTEPTVPPDPPTETDPAPGHPSHSAGMAPTTGTGGIAAGGPAA